MSRMVIRTHISGSPDLLVLYSRLSKIKFILNVGKLYNFDYLQNEFIPMVSIFQIFMEISKKNCYLMLYYFQAICTVACVLSCFVFLSLLTPLPTARLSVSTHVALR